MLIHINDITNALYEEIKALYEKGERSFNFEIDSYGGSLDAAFRIYDLMRGDSENKVTASVKGNCISAATVILLSAPIQNRTATSNSVFLIHSPLININCDVNKSSINNLKNEIESAYDQLKSIYNDRTTINELADSYMTNEKPFYSKEAISLGFISKIDELYNNKKSYFMKLKNFIFNLISQLKNEKYVTKDGIEFEALTLEIGAPVENISDGVYTLEDDTVITIENGVIIDIIAPTEETPVEQVEDVVNEETPVTETPVEQVEEKVEEIAEEVKDETVETIEEAVSPEEVTKAVEEAIATLKEQIIEEYKPLVDLVEACGGKQRLLALKNAKNDNKHFDSEINNKNMSSLEMLMNKVRK